MKLQSPFPETLFSTSSGLPAVAFASVAKSEISSLPVNPSDRRNSSAFKPHRAEDFVLGRLAARRALSELQRLRPETSVDSKLGRGKGGETLWPPSTVGAISHTRGVAVAAVASSEDVRAIGIDVEREGERALGVLKRIASDNERNWVMSEPKLAELRAMILFSTKESIYKALYPLCQRYFGFHAVELCDSKGSGPSGHSPSGQRLSENRLTAELTCELSSELIKGLTFPTDYSYQEGFVITGVCLMQTPASG